MGGMCGDKYWRLSKHKKEVSLVSYLVIFIKDLRIITI